MKRLYFLLFTLVYSALTLSASTVYFINSDNWTTINAYVWGDGEKVEWPGEAMTKTSDQVNGFDVYSYTVDEVVYPNIIFTNKKDGSDQTEDLTVQPGQYYYWRTKQWYSSVSDVPALDDNPPVVTPVTDPMNEAY